MYMDNHVTKQELKQEFNDFGAKITKIFATKQELKQEFNDFGAKITKIFATKQELKDFEIKVDRRFDVVDRRFDELRERLNEDYERHTGIIVEQMNHNIQLALEHMTAMVEKKADREAMLERFAEIDKWVNSRYRR